MTQKLSFDQHYKTLFQSILTRTNNNPTNTTNTQLTSHTFTTNFPNNQTSENINQSIKQSHQNQQLNILINTQIKPIKQTNYFVFGQSPKAKSLQLTKTFVNLGNNRYQINRTPPPEFNKTQTYFLKNIDFQKTTYNVNTLVFPIIKEKSKHNHNQSPNFTLYQEPPKISSKLKSLSGRKKNRLGNSLQLRVQSKSFYSKSLSKKPSKNQFTPQVILSNPETQNKSFKSISQLSKSVDLKASQFLKQMIFAKQYEKKLYEMQNTIILKKRLQKLKRNKKQNLNTEKQSIDPWKRQHTNVNTPQDIGQIFANLTQKPLFY